MKLIDPQNKILFHLDRVQSLKKGETTYPVSVEMDLSDRCNLRCSWCRFAYAHKSNIMPLWLAKKILGELYDAGVKSVVYSGGGEPLINPHFEKIADYGYSLGLDQGIYTNATVNVAKNAKALRDKMLFVYISLDAYTKETYLKIKGLDRLDEVLKNVALLCSKERRAKIGLGFLVSPSNYTEILPFRRYLDLGVDYIQYRPAVENIERKKIVPFLREVRSALELIENSNVIVAWYKFDDLLKNRTYSKCFGHNFLGGISADGTVWLCLNHRYHGGFDIGNIKTQTFKEIWNGERRREAINRINLQECPKQCRPHELNKFLDFVMADENPHKNFL